MKNTKYFITAAILVTALIVLLRMVTMSPNTSLKGSKATVWPMGDHYLPHIP